MATEAKPSVTLTRAHLCEMLDRSEAAVDRDIAVGNIPPGFKIGRSRRWLRSEIEAWLAAGVGEAISRAYFGEVRLPEGDAETGRLPVAVFGAATAARVLRECALGAGEVAARTIEQDNPPVDVWVMMCDHDGVTMRGFGPDDALLIHTSLGYRAGKAQTVLETLQDEGPSRFGLMTEHGGVHVYARSGADAAIAAALVGIVLTGQATVPYQGREVTVPVGDDALSDLLFRVYGGADGPHQVAEAVRALRRLPGDRDHRLMRVLRNRPRLAELYRRVREELTGEAA
jgi:predicted DNA-binding transcriptional regulator AlpA